MDPSGSSSGPGVSSSIGLALASLGTETSGSILSPSSRNWLSPSSRNCLWYQAKCGTDEPLFGCANLPGTYLSLHLLIVRIKILLEPMARTVRDAAVILSVIAGIDPNVFPMVSSSDQYRTTIPLRSPSPAVSFPTTTNTRLPVSPTPS
jgi:amidase